MLFTNNVTRWTPLASALSFPGLKEAVAKGYAAEPDGFFRLGNSSTYKAEL